MPNCVLDEGDTDDVALHTLNGISVCSGVDGLGLGVRLGLRELGYDYRAVCHIEREASCAAALVARMAEQTLDQAPIWDDLGTFDGNPWRGVVDIVIAGLPCQPYSVAGQKRGDADERYIWPDFFRLLETVRPALVLLENVPALLGWFEPIGERLSAMGYAFEAGIFSADEVGASHKRERLFVLAHCGHEHSDLLQRSLRNELAGSECVLAHGPCGGLGELREPPRRNGQPDGCDSHLEYTQRQPGDSEQEYQPEMQAGITKRAGAAVADRQDTDRRAEPERDGRDWPGLASRSLPPFPPGPNDRAGWARVLELRPDLAPATTPKPEVRDMADESPRGLGFGRPDQLRMLGNSVVPLTAAYALCTLWEKLMEGMDAGINS